MKIECECPQCLQHFSLDSQSADGRVTCPSCSHVFANVPDSQPAAPPALPAIFCPKCGQQNDQNNYKCTRCGFVLHTAPPPPYVAGDDSGLGGLIPYKNAQALWAYYLAIFSLIPCVGSPLGIAALILGIRALKVAKARPEAKGTGHAWVGIILGGLCGVVYTVGIVAGLSALVATKHR